MSNARRIEIQRGNEAALQSQEIPTKLDEIIASNPISVFDERKVAENSAVFQESFVHSLLLPRVVANTANSGTVTLEDQLAKLKTGTDIGAFAAIRTKRYVRYNPGRGTEWKGTAIFTPGVANSLQIAGLGTAEAAFAVGYDGAKFGVARQTGGRIEIQVLEITLGGGPEIATITLDGDVFMVGLTGTSDEQVAADIAESPFTGWNVYAVGKYVYFVAANSGPRGGVYSFSSAVVTGSFTRNQEGTENTWSWSYMDPLEANTWNYNGNSGLDFTLDTTKGNIYRITFGYLGFDGILFEVKSPVSQMFVPLHYMEYLNANIVPNTQDPSMQGLCAIASLGSTTDLTLSIGSISGDIQGKIFLSGEEFGTSGGQSGLTVSSSNWENILTIRVNTTFGATGSHKINRGQIKILSAGISMAGGSKPVEVALFKNATLGGTQHIWEEEDSDSMVSIQRSKVQVSNGKEVRARTTSPGGSVEFNLYDSLQFLEAGDTLSLAVRIPIGGSSPDGSGAINWIEDN